ncbi:PREDICTED: neurogenic protein big brain [Dufourea novaeangliae]|uniref:Neurogenic protein big brain n=1 Tax=Dufourea novaeangliae TaxID=178035 RepID=A0A154PT59_DUFNO|nr:PREDICTED: neurogenic protein big brain [Dufourea novaeangliae]KZC14448.1 Neurogenic protein big brain [Dufourea novaeangliae]
MTTETLSREVDAHIVTLLTRISALKENNPELIERKPSVSIEARSLELWRAVAVECFATFLFSLVVSGAAASSAVSGSGLSILATAVASGFAIAAISLIFGHISGGHVNPAVSVSFALCRRISLLRAALYVAAQCGGGIAGAAMLYGVTTPSNTQTLTSPGRLGGAIERLLVELALSVLIVLAHFTAESSKSLPMSVSSKPAGVLAAAYTAATLVSSPFLNPARALGPAFVSNRWDNHWVYWVGPLSGSAVAALLHEYVLNPKRSRDPREIDDGDNSSLRSDEDTYDDLDKPTGPKFPSAYATYRPVAAGASSSIYSAPPTALERVESIYGGTKSLYCKSPPLTRANLNRSQSVYAKSTTGTKDGLMIPKPGPLVPAQSLYPIRIGQTGTQTTREGQPSSGPSGPSPNTQNHNSTNQNMQNQLQQCTQSIYGIRGISTSLSTRENGIYGVSTGSSIYGRAPAPPPSGNQSSPSGPTVQTTGQTHHQQQQQPQQQQQQPPQQQPQMTTNSENTTTTRRPESMYGHISRRSDDSAYGSYQGSTRGNYGKVPGPPPGPPQYRDQGRPSPAGPLQQSQQNFQRNSPNPQY